MTAKELRNHIVRLLWEYLKIPVILSDQAQPEVDPPFMIYTVTTPYSSTGEMGDVTWRPDGADRLLEDRLEMPSATLSFTVCSENRTGKHGKEISGADEAEDLADKAVGYFKHVGYDDFARLGICVVDVGPVQDRTTLMVDEASRRKGFDVRIRYTRTDTRKISTVEGVAITQKGVNDL